MRKPRDLDAELKLLTERARQLKSRKQHQLGALVIATGADTLSIDELAGALLQAARTRDAGTKEGWRRAGAAFFQGTASGAANNARDDAAGNPTNSSGPEPGSGQNRA